MEAMRLLFASLAVAAGGCFNTASSGNQGHADFSWQDCLLGCPLDQHSMAAGGARAGITATVHQGEPAIGSVASSNPSVATFARGQNPSDVVATAGQPGSADLILVDGNGNQIDRATVTVKPTTTLAFDHGWPDNGPPPNVLAGAVDELHTTTMNGSEVLVGTGAVKFTPTTNVKPGGGIVFGDSFSFVGDPGMGTIDADCVDAHIAVLFNFLPSTAITSVSASMQSITFSHSAKGDVDITVQAGAVPLFDAECAWTMMPAAGLTASRIQGGIAGGPVSRWQLSGQVGNYTAVCTVPGGKSVTLSITVD